MHTVTLVYYAFDQVEDSNAALFGLSLGLGESHEDPLSDDVKIPFPNIFPN